MAAVGRYLEAPQLADVEVEADGRLFHAHRIVLARHSLRLRRILEDAAHLPLPLRIVVRSWGACEEGELPEGDFTHGHIELPPGAWPMVASFMYAGSVMLHSNNVLPLFDSAARLKVCGYSIHDL
jgi:hypothetical protein